MVIAPEWQEPFINVFKICEVESWKHVTKEGNVVFALDKSIGKRAFCISGSIPACNFLLFPKQRHQNLGLTGCYLYLQLQVNPAVDWAAHVEVTDAVDKVHRLSLSNIYKAGTEKKAHGSLQIAVSCLTERWTTLALDLKALLKQLSGAALKFVRRIQFCANMRVRGAYTSNTIYTLQTLPRDMVLNTAMSSDSFDFVWLPESPAGSDVSGPAGTQAPGAAQRKAPGVLQPQPRRQPVPAQHEKAPQAGLQEPGIAQQAAPDPQPPQQTCVRPEATMKPVHARPTKAAPADFTEATDARPAAAADTPHLPFQQSIPPALGIVRTNGFTGEYSNTLSWVPGMAREVVFLAGNNAVMMNVESGCQRLLHGHTDTVTNLTLSADGLKLATAQYGKTALIRLWDVPSATCTGVLCGHAAGIICLDLSPDGHTLLAVGLNAVSKQQMVLWDVSAGRPQAAELLVQATTEFNIRRARFSVYEPDKFMTVGRDSIRMYRCKRGALRGLSIRVTDVEKKAAATVGLAAAAVGHDIFTDLAFEQGTGATLLLDRHVFVASAAGAVYQINYDNQALEAVYQLHNAAINSLVVNEGFVITGSDDKTVRVWPQDFSDFVMEAEHETAVTSVSVSSCGLQVCIGAESGSLGVLDIATHQYNTLLRSHTDAVNAVVLDCTLQLCVTASSDGTVRVWSLDSYQQLYEFDIPGELVETISCHPSQQVVACGFTSGRLRVFEIPSTSLQHELQVHRGHVCQVQYSTCGTVLFSVGEDAQLRSHDTEHLYTAIKVLPLSTQPLKQPPMAVSTGSQPLVAVAVKAAGPHASLLLFRGATLEPELKIDTESPDFTRLAFEVEGEELWGATSDNKLERYSCRTGQLVSIVDAQHNDHISMLSVHPRGTPHASRLLTGGRDGIVKVWSIPRDEGGASQLRPEAVQQSFLGHSGAVTGATVCDNLLITCDSGDCVLFWYWPWDDPADAHTGSAAHKLPGCLGKPDGQAEMGRPDGALLAGMAPEPNAWPGNVHQGMVPGPPHLHTLRADMLGCLPGVHGGPAGGPAGTPRGAHLAGGHLCSDAVMGVPYEHPRTALWLPQHGVLAYAVDNSVVLEGLETKRRRYLVHSSQVVTRLAAAGVTGLVLAAACSKEVHGSSDATAPICIWDTGTATCSHVLRYHPSAVEAMAFSPDGTVLVSLGAAPEMCAVVWDVVKGSVVAVGRASSPMLDIAWLPGRAQVQFVTVSRTTCERWVLQDHQLERHQIALPADASRAGCTSVCVSDGRAVFVGDHQGKVWEVQHESAGREAVLAAWVPKQDIRQLCVSAARMVAFTRSGQIHALKYGAGSWHADTQIDLDGPILAASLSEDLTEGVVSTASATLWHVNLATRDHLPLLSGHAEPILALVACPVDPTLFCSVCCRGPLRLWQFVPGDTLLLIEFESPVFCCGAAFAPTGDTLVAGFTDGSLRAFDLASIAVAWTASPHGCAVAGLAVDACRGGGTGGGGAVDNGGVVLSLGTDGSAAFVWPVTGDPADPGSRATSCVETVAEGLGGCEVEAFEAGSDHAGAALVAVAWQSGVAVFDIDWQTQRLHLVGRHEDAAAPMGSAGKVGKANVAFAHHQEHCVFYTGSGVVSSVVLFDYLSSTVLTTIQLPTVPTSLGVHGELLAIGGADGSLSVVDLATGGRRRLMGHIQPVQALLFIGDSMHLISAARSTLLHWRMPTS